MALAQRQETRQLGLDRGDEVVDCHPLRGELGDLVDAQEFVVRALGSSVALVSEARDLGDEEPDREQEHRGADVFGLVDLE